MSDADPTKPDLSLVDTEWMVAELMNRHTALFMVREKTAPQGSDTDTIIDYSGGLSTCIGLAVRGRAVLVRDATAAYGRVRPDDTNR